MEKPTKRGAVAAWLRYFPPAGWLVEYKAAWLAGDLIAGVTLAAYAIPVSLAYAGLAGLPELSPNFGDERGSGGSGLSLRSDDLDSVVELYTEDNFRQLVVTAETIPTFLGGLCELEDHGEGGLV